MRGYGSMYGLDSFAGQIGPMKQILLANALMNAACTGGAGGRRPARQSGASPFNPELLRGCPPDAMVPRLPFAEGMDLPGHPGDWLSPEGMIEGARGDDLMYGFATLVAGLATVTLQTQPQIAHIPKRLIVNDGVAESFEIIDFKVGTDSILATAGQNMSMAPFKSNSNAPNFRAVPCEVGKLVSITVQNITALPARFSVSIIGPYIPVFGRIF